MKINIGGGLTRYEGFVNLDIDPNSQPDFLVDLECDRLPFDDDQVDEVKAHHILEHIGAGFFHLLQELYRVCKHGAIIDIRVPHPRHDTFLNDPTHVRAITINGMQMFSKKANDLEIERYHSAPGLAHRFGVDFEIVAFNLIPDEFYTAIIQRSSSPEQLERLSREANNFFGEIYMRLVVIK